MDRSVMGFFSDQFIGRHSFHIIYHYHQYYLCGYALQQKMTRRFSIDTVRPKHGRDRDMYTEYILHTSQE